MGGAVKILCIQLRQMGDCIVTTPAVRQLRQLYQEAEIIFMTEQLGANVYQNSPHISGLWIVPSKPNLLQILKLFWRIYRYKFDLTIDFFSNPKSAQLSFISRAKERVGFDFRLRRYAYTLRVPIADPNEYAAKAKNRLIAHLGGDINDTDIEFPADHNAQIAAIKFAKRYDFNERVIAFCVVSRREYKLLPPDFFAAIGNALIANGYKLFFVYGPGEKELARTVYDRINLRDHSIFDYEMPNIQELRAILEKCVLYVGNDGGSKHLSVCAGLTTITVFNGVQAENWTSAGHIAFHAERGVKSEEVIAAALNILKGKE